MGLDQCAYTRSDRERPEEAEPVFVWRKHAKLQEFMERLFVERTGSPAMELNCGELELTADDIATLEGLVRSNALPQSDGGFFYGHQFQEETAREERWKDLAFCKWAEALLRTRRRVFYSCWW